jgi:hypothetical protein
VGLTRNFTFLSAPPGSPDLLRTVARHAPSPLTVAALEGHRGVRRALAVILVLSARRLEHPSSWTAVRPRASPAPPLAAGRLPPPALALHLRRWILFRRVRSHQASVNSFTHRSTQRIRS